MSTVLTLLLLWVVVSAGLLTAMHGRLLRALWREPVLTRPVVIVESDDWGPGPGTDAGILRAIAASLDAIRDRSGRPAVMTLGIVLGVPDGAAILAGKGKVYARRSLAEPEFAPIVAAIRDGCATRVFALQRHGLEHFWPAALLARLADDEALREWLADPSTRSEALPAALQSRWVDSARLPSTPLAPPAIEAAVREEAALFKQVFGELPEVAVPNTFVWDDALERAWAAHGVRCVVTPGCRYEGRDAAGNLGPPTRRIRNGECGVGGLRYVVRNDYFEPIRGHRAERVWQAVATRTAQGRPTLLEMHRESFIAAPGDARAALSELERALRGAVARHPALCFMRTAELACHFGDPASPLLACGLPMRLRVWLRRLQAEPPCARLLKTTGLAWPLRFAGWLLGMRARNGTPAARTGQSSSTPLSGRTDR
ncbi:hypothetical protein [Aromatoleum anaerobium]|uniref:hypothetical protein n=1 Tax=Aromatoleum anaerobium TaxID=182180 RepID=UPI001FF3EDA8|nr:hypothetical protein [Aromatoleum anaerobium]MCK0509216.1 hypothetical protein [Aromatoleum anaerobium]